MPSPRFLPAVLAAVAAAAIVATGPSPAVRAQTMMIAQNATLNGDGAGSFASHTATLTACSEYTLRLSYSMQTGGTPAENGIGVELWNDEGDAYLTSLPFGERLLHAPSQKYYLRSFRTAANPFVEEIRFKAGQSMTVAPWCNDLTPNLSFRVFNYLTGNTLTYTLSLPAGDEN